GMLIPAAPLVLFDVFVVAQVARSFTHPELRSYWAVLSFLTVISVMLAWQFFVPKNVSIDSQYLYISALNGEEIRVPLSEMKEAHYNSLSKTVAITLKSPTRFGQDIHFFPKSRFHLGLPTVTDELIDIINSLEDKADPPQTSTQQI